MQKLNFKNFSQAVKEQFEKITNGGFTVARSAIQKECLYEEYLKSFPTELQTTFRKRQHYDCIADKTFIYRIGAVVGIDSDFNLHTIWDVDVEGYYQDVANKMRDLVLSSDVSTLYFTSENKAGSLPNVDNYDPNIIWDHFYATIPQAFIKNPTEIGGINTDLSLFKKSLNSFNKEDAEYILDTVQNSSVPQGPSFIPILTSFIKHKEIYDSLSDIEKKYYCLSSVAKGEVKYRYSSSVIGSFLEDLAEEKEFEHALKSFIKKVDPLNYKRTQATIVSPLVIKKAQEALEEKGLIDSIHRRCVEESEIPLEHVLYKKSTTASLDVFAEMSQSYTSTIKKDSLKNVQEINVEDFIQNELPGCSNLEVLFENKHTNNLVTLTTSDAEKSIFKWGNNFAWSYRGEVTDSLLRQDVERLGGRVDGALRFSHTWNYDQNKPNQSLMDLHVFFGKGAEDIPLTKEVHNIYPKTRRVGWNQRTDSASKGTQDVDYTEAPGKNIPVENITFPDINLLPEGLYVFKIHNWGYRNNSLSGFKAEIEVNNGELFSFEYEKPLKNREWVTVATATLKDKVFTVNPILAEDKASKEVWGLKTNTWVNVNKVIRSPNCWGGDHVIGNPHIFFLTDECKTDEEVRGIYNEFLHNELTPMRKFFDVLASKTKIKDIEKQTSGLGFNSTSRANLVLRCKTNNRTKLFLIKF